jgi:hypothetical protein
MPRPRPLFTRAIYPSVFLLVFHISLMPTFSCNDQPSRLIYKHSPSDNTRCASTTNRLSSCSERGKDSAYHLRVPSGACRRTLVAWALGWAWALVSVSVSVGGLTHKRCLPSKIAKWKHSSVVASASAAAA